MERTVLNSSRLGAFCIWWGKKCSLENKIEKNYCQARKSPYNAPPLTDAERRHAAEDSERKAKISA
ncbi:hypothetical protein, partial [Xenorhabdus bovienii]|uniref:hypothetical protein n=1 Tax=Xenorhabdus bovienii TaxID=40576 RepID=UPI0023B2C7B5